MRHSYCSGRREKTFLHDDIGCLRKDSVAFKEYSVRSIQGKLLGGSRFWAESGMGFAYDLS